MRFPLADRLMDSAKRMRGASIPGMKELEVYGAVALGGIIFLIIVFRLLSR